MPMNMLRVWVRWYKRLFPISVTLGILVWQDAMFSCSLYPADGAFLAEVAAEIADNAARLQHRLPCCLVRR